MMRRLWFLLLLLVIFFCATRKTYTYEPFESGFIYYLLKQNPDSQVQLLEGNNVLLNSTGEGTHKTLKPNDPDLYGELMTDGDKMDYNGETANITYYKRKNNFITVNFENSDESPITFSGTDDNNVTSILHKNSEIGTIEDGADGNQTIRMIAHPDATKYLPHIVAGHLKVRDLSVS